jgi:hypothetical protein
VKSSRISGAVVIFGVAIFSATDVQAAFNGVSPLLSESGAKQMLGRLESRTAKDALSAEWEVVLMNALRSCGSVEIEPLLESGGGESHPDVLLRSDTDGSLAMLPPCYIEISAISDDGFEDENPQRLFIEAFRRLLNRLRLPIERFRIDIRGAIQDKTDQKRKATELNDGTPRKEPIDWVKWFRGSTCNDRKMRLGLPPKSKIEPLVRRKIAHALRAVSDEPSRCHSIPIDDNGILIDIRYHPQGTGFSYGFPSYTTAYSLDYNPVANRLNTKADQLAKGSGARGVILCDRGCDLLVDRGYPGPEGFRLRDVVTNVLARRDEISFVVTYAIHQKVNGWGRYEGLELSVGAFYNPQKAAFPVGEVELDTLVRRISDNLPAPMEAPKNASYAFGKQRQLTNTFSGSRWGA